MYKRLIVLILVIIFIFSILGFKKDNKKENFKNKKYLQKLILIPKFGYSVPMIKKIYKIKSVGNYGMSQVILTRIIKRKNLKLKINYHFTSDGVTYIANPEKHLFYALDGMKVEFPINFYYKIKLLLIKKYSKFLIKSKPYKWKILYKKKLILIDNTYLWKIPKPTYINISLNKNYFTIKWNYININQYYYNEK